MSGLRRSDGPTLAAALVCFVVLSAVLGLRISGTAADDELAGPTDVAGASDPVTEGSTEALPDDLVQTTQPTTASGTGPTTPEVQVERSFIVPVQVPTGDPLTDPENAPAIYLPADCAQPVLAPIAGTAVRVVRPSAANEARGMIRLQDGAGVVHVLSNLVAINAGIVDTVAMSTGTPVGFPAPYLAGCAVRYALSPDAVSDDLSGVIDVLPFVAAWSAGDVSDDPLVALQEFQDAGG